MRKRLQEIKFSRKGEAYITKYGKRYYLDKFIRTREGTTYNGLPLHGIYAFSAFNGLGISITKDNAHAYVFYIVN